MQQGRFDLNGEFHGPAAEPGARRVAWVPAEQVLLLGVSVPGRQWRKALPYAVEPYLASTLEASRIVPLHRERSGMVHCAVVDGQRLQQWRSALEQAGWGDALLVPDCFEVAPEAGAWRWIEDDGRMRVRCGQWRGFAGDAAMCEAVRAQAGSEWARGERVAPDWRTLRVFDLSAGKRAGGAEGVAWRRWWPAGAAALLLLSVYLGQLMWETQRLNAQAAAYRSQTEALFRQLFPQVGRIVNIRAQLKHGLQQRSQPQASARWAEALAAVARAGGKLVRLEMEGGRLTMTVRLPQAADVRALASEMGARLQGRREVNGAQEVTYVVAD